ncbi:MAG TPA: ATP-binding protein [Gemmatimonadales bacterium]|nr:ATP-binding protein [Gemmatimonadales bacterium]
MRRLSPDQQWALLVLAIGVALGAWNVLTPAERPFPGFLIILPLIAAARCRPSITGLFGVVAFGGTVALTLRQSAELRPDQVVRLLTILAAGGLAVVLSYGRARAENALRAVYRIAEAALAAPDLATLYRAIHEIIGELMDARNFYLALHDADRDLVSFSYWASEKDPQPEPRPLGNGLTDYVIRSGRLVHWGHEMPAELVGSGVQATGSESEDWLGVPLLLGDRTIGALVVQSYSKRVSYHRGDERVLQYVAGSVARAIERKRAEDALRANELQLRQAQKLEAVGRLAGGVAHDFNNLLTIMLGEVEFVEEQLPAGSPLREPVESMRRAADSAAALTQQLLAFSRRQVVVPTPTDLNALVANAEKMLRRVIGEHIELVAKLDPELGTTRVDPGQIEQVLLNLAVNAHDAMPNGGTLTLETHNASLDAGYVRSHPGASVGDFVVIALSDSGTGIPPEVMPHIFEPFFTTKPVGQGTGLGLATCYGIVKQAGGSIEVYTEPGLGTTFRIYLPRIAEPARAELQPALRGAPGGSETILVVEDSAAVRAVAARALGALGYQVLEAANGQQALELLASAARPVQAVITDVVMPAMGGRELADRIRELWPRTRVLFSSGYTDDVVIRQRLLEPGTAFLPKPYTAAELAWKLRELLDAKPG